MMNRPFLFLLSFLLLNSCVSDETVSTVSDSDSMEEDTTEIIDTFSVKRPMKLTEEEKKQLAADSAEVNQIISDAQLIINGGSEQPSATDPDQSMVVKNPDQAPSFPGGQTAMSNWFKKKLIYPVVAFQNDIKGNVMLKVVIEPDGKIGGITVSKGLGYGCDESAVDCVRTMPNWVPGKKNGIAVRTSVVLAVPFGDQVDMN
jgi:TonB family protein